MERKLRYATLTTQVRVALPVMQDAQFDDYLFSTGGGTDWVHRLGARRLDRKPNYTEQPSQTGRRW